MWEDKFWNEMKRMRRNMNRMFGFSDFPRKNFDSEFSNYRDAYADFDENENEFIIIVEIPGIDKENINLQVLDNNRLLVKAEKKQEIEKKEEDDGESFNYRYVKMYAGFYRTFDLPEEADIDNIDAEYKEGILKITILKKKEARKKKIIKIK